MKRKFTKLIAALALLVFMTPSLAGWGQTTSQQQLTNADIVAAGNAANGYASYSIEDGSGNIWNAYAIKNKHSNATSAYHFLQIRKNDNNGPYYIQVPELGTKITSITMTVSNTSQPMTGGGNSATLYFSNSNSTSSTGTGVASGSGDSSVTIDCSTLNLNTGYITAGGAVRIWDVSVTYTNGSGPTTYTVTYDGNGATSGTAPTDSNSPYEANASVTVLGNTGNLAKPGNNWSGWCLNDGGTGTVYGPDYTTTYTISSNTTFYAKWTPRTHNVTMPAADTYGSYSASATSNVPYGTTVTLTYTPATGYTDYMPTWSVNGTAISGNTFSMPDEDVTVTVSLAQVKIDELTQSFTGVSGGYTYWTNTSNISGATYVGVTGGSSQSNYIQLNKGSYTPGQSGIVTTGSGGKAKKVVVTWNSTTQSGRVLNIYGNNNAYSGTSDLYSNSADTQGTLLGTIVYGTSTELVISDDYKYIGIVTASGAAYLTKIEIYWAPSNDPSISANDVNITYNATSGNVAYTINNEPTPAGTLTAAIVSGGTIADLALGTIANNTVPFTCAANTAAAERTATVTLTYTYGDNQTTTKDVTITQAGNPDAVHLISDINATGTNYTIRGTVVALSNQACVIGDGTGYVYFYNGYAAPTYTGGSTKVNVGDKVKVSGNMTSYGHIYQFSTYNNNTATIETATTSNYEGTPAVTTITAIPTSTYSTGLHLSDYFQFEGKLTKAANATNYYVGVGDGQIQISYPSSAQQTTMNALLNKTVRVKGYFAGINSTNYFSVVMESIEGIPYITIESEEFELTAAEEAGYLEIEYGNFNPISFDIVYCDANGEELSEDPDWFMLAIEAPQGETGDFVYYVAAANDGEARTAYFKVYASLGENQGEVYSNLVTVTQAAPVVDYATLPFNWGGGTSAELTALSGVSGYSLGDYAEGHAPYRVQFNATGDYILIKTNEQPAEVSVGIKKVGGSGNSSIIIQSSSNGTDFTEVETFSNPGAQDAILTHVTTNAFAATDRYVRIYFNKPSNSSNVGVGPITIRGLTHTLFIAKHGATTADGGWHLIASPVASVTPSTENGFIAEPAENYDLYYFDQSADKEWKNYKKNTFNLVSGQGYLYANGNEDGTTLTFAGTPYTGDGKVTLTYTASADFAGFNLIGNPFSTAATIDMPFYRMNAAGSALNANTETGQVAAMEGVFVYAYDEGQSQAITTATFTRASRSGNAPQGIVNLNVEHNASVIDNAIVRFDGGLTLPKFMFNEDNAKLYISRNGKEYAVVSTEAQGEMSVNFKATENGTYTLTVNPEGVEMNYLHLIDNMTGNDIDLLQTPRYSFNATTNDYESRFRLVFASNGASTGSASFAFMSDGNWIINNAGEATLQVIDINGRILSSERVNGSVSKTINATPGVYMLRLINGENVMVQKIVVR